VTEASADGSMIDDVVRQGILAVPAPTEKVVVFASRPETYRALLAGRRDVRVLAIGDAASVPHGCATVVVEGIDDVEDPLALLRAIAPVGSAVRVIALVANAAFAPALDAFIAGGLLAGGHAYVESELTPLFEAAGLRMESITPVFGGVPGSPALPTDLSTGRVKFRVDTADVLARLHVAAYIAIARTP